jgi:DNA-binding HxlR family transcriptional regulator
VELTESVLGGKWKMPILWRLNARVWRYNELLKNLGRVTPKMLTQQLRELESDGLIAREVFPVVPPKVEYRLTEVGKTTIPLIEVLRAWGNWYREQTGE